MAPLLEDRLLVLCRGSVHIASGVRGSLADVQQDEITREIGCIARKSIVEVGGTVVWLSDQGVYSATYGQELNLIANAIPMSEPIQQYIRAINWEYAENAVAAYHDNRYFLAIPFGQSKVNNVVLVYNFLNGGWESMDTFPDGFNITNLIVAPKAGVNALFSTNADGAVHISDQDYGFDRFELTVGDELSEPVEGRLVTRRYNMGSMDVKRFSRSTTLAESASDLIPENSPERFRTGTTSGITSDLAIRYATKDPDTDNPKEPVAETFRVESGEDYTIRTRFGRRGYGLQLIYETTGAKIRACTVEAITTGRSNIDRS